MRIQVESHSIAAGTAYHWDKPGKSALNLHPRGDILVKFLESPSSRVTESEWLAADRSVAKDSQANYTTVRKWGNSGRPHHN